LFDIRSVEMT